MIAEQLHAVRRSNCTGVGRRTH